MSERFDVRYTSLIATIPIFGSCSWFLHTDDRSVRNRLIPTLLVCFRARALPRDLPHLLRAHLKPTFNSSTRRKRPLPAKRPVCLASTFRLFKHSIKFTKSSTSRGSAEGTYPRLPLNETALPSLLLCKILKVFNKSYYFRIGFSEFTVLISTV